MTLTAPHPLGPLADLVSLAQAWRAHGAGLGATWAGIWHPHLRDEIVQAITQHAAMVDEAERQRLARRWALSGVRDYSALLALLPLSDAATPDRQREHASPAAES